MSLEQSAQAPAGMSSEPPSAPETLAPRTPAEEARLAEMVDHHFDFVWRSLRRHGLPPAAADDAAQQVFIVAARRLADIRPDAERSFLFQTALRVASDASRAHARRREDAREEAIADVRDPSPSPEDALQRKRALEVLDEVLASMPDELRETFCLVEIEGLEIKEVAEIVGVPVGTAASRLRLGREAFHLAAKRVRARREFEERKR